MRTCSCRFWVRQKGRTEVDGVQAKNRSGTSGMSGNLAMRETLLLVDAVHQMYRAFHALPELYDSSGNPVNAIIGFNRMLHGWIRDYQPTHVAVVFDRGRSERRLSAFPEYKAGRPAQPPEMVMQIPRLREFLSALHFVTVEKECEEADDLIASLALSAANRRIEVLVASNDKDFSQLVGEHIRWLRTGRKGAKVYSLDDVTQMMGVPPQQVVDLLSLTGDTSDNIPGVPGIGAKTAAALLREFGSLEELLCNVQRVSQPKLRQAIKDNVAQLRTNRSLIQLSNDIVPLVDIDCLRIVPPDREALRSLSGQCGFTSPWDMSAQTTLLLDVE